MSFTAPGCRERVGRVYQQVAALGNELLKAGAVVDGLVPDAGVGLLWSNASAWAMSFEAPFAGDDPWSDRNPAAYGRIAEAFYRGAFEAGVGVRIVHDVQLVDGGDMITPDVFVRDCPVLLVPGLYVADDALLDWLRRYVTAGGHLVLGPRSAFADADANVRPAPKPAGLDDLAGVTYQEISNINDALSVSGSAKLALPADAKATLLADALIASDDADVLARYDHPHHGKFAAIVSHGDGTGRVTTVGTVPNAALAQAIVQWAVPGDDPWRALNQGSTTVTSATVSGGRRLHVVHQWSWTPKQITLPEAVTDALAPDVQLPAGSVVDLGPWDVKVLVS